MDPSLGRAAIECGVCRRFLEGALRGDRPRGKMMGKMKDQGFFCKAFGLPICWFDDAPIISCDERTNVGSTKSLDRQAFGWFVVRRLHLG